MLELTKSDGVVNLMKSSKTKKEWEKNCDSVKAANGGKYPYFWYDAVEQSRLYQACVVKNAATWEDYL